MNNSCEQDSSVDAPPPARAIVSSAQERLIAGLVLAGCVAVLGIAVWLDPDRRGYGTAEQLNTGPCGVLVMTGLPCPTCGMTTAFSHVVRGQLVRGFWAQPAGMLLAIATIGLAGLSMWVLVRGRWPRGQWAWVSPHWLFLALLLVLLGGWAFKIVVGLGDGTLPYR